jgi:isochorismate synthase
MTLEDFFNGIEQQYNHQLPFVAYRKPNRLEIKALLQKTDTLHITNGFTESGFVFSPFDDSQNTVLMPLEACDVIGSSNVTLSAPDNYRDETSKNTTVINEDAKNNHINLIKKGITAIENKQFDKVVLSRAELVTLPEPNPIAILKNLLNTYASAFVYCWFHPKVGLWLGATPETLLKIEGNRFSMMALAGTQDYKGTLDVNWQAKELEEQQIVTDFVVENLASLVKNIKVSDVETVKAGNLLHLKTMITAQLKPEFSDLKKVILKLHPTPAVCGFPKDVTKQFILNNESYNREFYTGFIGELNFETTSAPRASSRNIENRAYAVVKKTTQLYVNLRCMQIDNNTGKLYVGGGITQSSNPEKEWEETVSKSMVIKNVL